MSIWCSWEHIGFDTLDAARMLRDQLTAWLETPKVRPDEPVADDGPGLFEEGS